MPGYLLKQACIAIAGAAPMQIQSLLDKQQFSDPLGVAQRLGISSATWPLFGVLWPSGAHLAARMATHVLQPGQRILEVGCGLGLASLVGHRRGADITASDRHPLAQQFLAANLLLNGLPPMKYRVGEWDSSAGQAASAPAARAQCFELIIGSDVLYDRNASQALAGFIGRHAMPSCEVWIVDPERGNRPGFSRRLEDLGFVTSQTRLDCAATADAEAYKGRMLTYRRMDPNTIKPSPPEPPEPPALPPARLRSARPSGC